MSNQSNSETRSSQGEAGSLNQGAFSQWQHGDTAPRDGTPFLSDIIGPYPCVTWYDESRDYPWRVFWHLGPDNLSGEDEPHVNGFMQPSGPNWWMPLPATP